jgi:hypothetical protein
VLVLLAGLALAAAQPVLTLPPGITESSGVATSSVSDEWFFTHEDSGAESEFHAVGLDGRLLATFRLGVQARDWEDMARGPDGAGGSSLLLADIGDNNAARELGLLVHRVPEPTVDPARDGVVADLPPVASYRLRYEDGPRDAETLLVHPGTGRLYVVSKGLLGDPRVYAAPERLEPDAPNILRQVASFRPERTGTPGGPGIGTIANQLVTAGDISPDGRRLALRTYTDLYEWWIEDGDVAGALDDAPVVTALPPTRQGEGLAYDRDGTALLTTTEGEPAPVHRVPSGLVVEPDADQGPLPAVDGWLVAVAALVVGALLLLLVVRARGRRRRGAGDPGRTVPQGETAAPRPDAPR